ncbi:formate dehydrogenase [soil metagenome]
MSGLGITYGRGGATTSLEDLQHSDCVLIEGSNMAEAHPVGFRHPMIAKEKGAKIIHVDPRFTRTSAMADIYAPIRPGTDIAFLGGLINYVIENERYFEEYVKRYTNAPTLITEDYEDMDASGIFAGWNDETNEYDESYWRYEGMPVTPAVGRSEEALTGEEFTERVERYRDEGGLPQDETLQHPRSVFQILKRHYAKYTPEMVERVTGCPKEAFLEVAETICDNSGRDKTTALCYSVGWTHHSKGSQLIRTAAMLQLLLGNIGRPGGGILALRGHATIQGSTDIATLYNLLPGYVAMPDANRGHDTWNDYVTKEAAHTGWWSELPAYATSIMKAWYGDAARPDNDYLFEHFPRLNGDHSYYPTIMDMKSGDVKGCFVFGQNFAVGGPHGKLARDAIRALDWFVVLDAYPIETSEAWKLDDVDPSTVGTEVFAIPSALVAEKEGSFTQTQRLVQWHDKSVDPPDDAKSDAWFVYNLGKRLQRMYADSGDPRDELIQAMTWDYGDVDGEGEPELESVLREINGYNVADGTPLNTFLELEDDGSTACGAWIYSGVYAEGVNQARRRKTGEYPHAEWGWAWPANRRILYNRASADPEGKPWSEEKKLVWWDEAEEKWTGIDIPDFQAQKHPGYRPGVEARGLEALPGDGPFIVNADGKGWLFAPTGLADGPLPVHYEPLESPVKNLMYDQQYDPAVKVYDREDNPYNAPLDQNYPYVITTYRLTEHHTTGAMSRWIPWLNELQPESFCEISPELAEEKGVENTDWVTLSTSRTKIHTRALVTDRIPVYQFEGKPLHTIGLPYHFGPNGPSDLPKADIANDLLPVSLEPNVSIHEAKAFSCNLEKGKV